jgi:hypothetical protein
MSTQRIRPLTIAALLTALLTSAALVFAGPPAPPHPNDDSGGAGSGSEEGHQPPSPHDPPQDSPDGHDGGDSSAGDPPVHEHGPGVAHTEQQPPTFVPERWSYATTDQLILRRHLDLRFAQLYLGYRAMGGEKSMPFAQWLIIKQVTVPWHVQWYLLRYAQIHRG